MPTALLAAALADVEAKLEAVRAHVQTDPLGAEGELRSQVEPALEEIARRIRAATQLGAQLRAARVRSDELVGVHTEAKKMSAEAQEKLAAGTALPALVAEDKLKGIQEWLTRLEHKREEGAVEAVAVGLRHWNAAAESCVQQDRKAYEVARASMEQRSELRGRFDALKAKARRFGMAENVELKDLCSKAESLLYRSPTNVEAAATAVAQYEKCLSGNGREA